MIEETVIRPARLANGHRLQPLPHRAGDVSGARHAFGCGGGIQPIEQARVDRDTGRGGGVRYFKGRITQQEKT
jgi:hypothetical protein